MFEGMAVKRETAEVFGESGSIGVVRRQLALCLGHERSALSLLRFYPTNDLETQGSSRRTR